MIIWDEHGNTNTPLVVEFMEHHLTLQWKPQQSIYQDGKIFPKACYCRIIMKTSHEMSSIRAGRKRYSKNLTKHGRCGNDSFNIQCQ